MTPTRHSAAGRTPLGVRCRLAAPGSRQGVALAGWARVMTGCHDGKAKAMKLLPIALIGALLASPAAALEPLSKEKYINDRLIAARIADRIRRTCPTIDGRILYAYGEARKLKSYARSKGYSNAQIDAFLDSKADKKRIYAVAEDYLTRKGAKPGNPQSFCAVGRNEIANKTIIGSLLVAK